MPELPDIIVYLDALRARVVGTVLRRILLVSPFVLRSVDPPVSAVEGGTVLAVRRLGKRIVLDFDDEVELVLHLMIAGRLRWREATGAAKARPAVPPKTLLAAFEFDTGMLLFTEASSHKRASIQLVRGARALAALDRGGIEPLDATLEEFRGALLRGSHTLKRALTDPRNFSGIGNAYSDEILHAARLSPLRRAQSLTDEEADRLYGAVRSTLRAWIERLRGEAAGGFPEKVTAFHDAMAVHGRYRKPCPVCGSPVQRIVYASNECNYCARCQTDGRLLADRSLSRLLRDDWPKSVDDF